MIDFRPFYQQIATTNLSAWLETLPLQLKEWEKQTHGDYAKWSKIVDFLPDLQADTIDLKNAVKSDRTSPLSEGEKTTHCPSFETIDAVAKRTLSFI
jgi:tRNA (mo5U34)-methyltransferase